MISLFMAQNVGLNNSLSVTPDTLFFTRNESIDAVTVTITPESSSPTISDNRTWITTSYNSSTKILTVYVTENTSGFDRFGTVTLTHPIDGTLVATVIVNQESI